MACVEPREPPYCPDGTEVAEMQNYFEGNVFYPSVLLWMPNMHEK
jgi:hypothetical protein